MYISVLELFKVGIGPSSSHTMGPMIAAKKFIECVKDFLSKNNISQNIAISCILKDSLAFTGKGHATDIGIILGINGYTPEKVAKYDVKTLVQNLYNKKSILVSNKNIHFSFNSIIFDTKNSFKEHPNGMKFNLIAENNKILFSQVYFSIGGGFIETLENFNKLQKEKKETGIRDCKYNFNSATSMIEMSKNSSLSIAELKLINELEHMSEKGLYQGLDNIYNSMFKCVENGISSKGILPGGLNVCRRAKNFYEKCCNKSNPAFDDWLCAYAMAINEENASGNMVVTAPTNGAAGVIPAVLYYFYKHENGTQKQLREFLLVAAAIGGIIKYKSSISGAEVGCQGEVGSASAMAAAGLCHIYGGTTEQVENAAEIALEHHLGMTCDPVGGLVQIPCIERNAFGAIKSYVAAKMAMNGDGTHIISLDSCIKAMKETGEEMSNKYKETSLGGLAVSNIEC